MRTNVENRWVEVDGLRVRYLKAGERNAPVLLLHGGGYDSASLSCKHAVGPVSEHHRAFAPDWPGYGESDKPKMEYTVEYYAGFWVASWTPWAWRRPASLGSPWVGPSP